MELGRPYPLHFFFDLLDNLPVTLLPALPAFPLICEALELCSLIYCHSL